MRNRILSGSSRLVRRFRIHWTIGGILMFNASLPGEGPALGMARPIAAEMIRCWSMILNDPRWSRDVSPMGNAG